MEPTVIEEFRKGITDIQSGIATTQKDLTGVKSHLQTVQDDNARLKTELDSVRKQLLVRGPIGATQRRPGFVSDACARHLAATFIVGNARAGRLDLPDARQR